jgi:hypothetical protein
VDCDIIAKKPLRGFFEAARLDRPATGNLFKLHARQSMMLKARLLVLQNCFTMDP